MEKTFPENLLELILKNETIILENPANLHFTEAYLVTIKHKKYFMLIDNQGFFNYFVTRNLKQFMFYGRWPGAKDVKNLSLHPFAHGMLINYDSHFVYSRHQSPVQEHVVCQPGSDVKIQQVIPDHHFMSTIYGITEDGKSLLVFNLDTKQTQTSFVRNKQTESFQAAKTRAHVEQSKPAVN